MDVLQHDVDQLRPFSNVRGGLCFDCKRHQQVVPGPIRVGTATATAHTSLTIINVAVAVAVAVAVIVVEQIVDVFVVLVVWYWMVLRFFFHPNTRPKPARFLVLVSNDVVQVPSLYVVSMTSSTGIVHVSIKLDRTECNLEMILDRGRSITISVLSS